MGPNADVYISETLAQTWRLYSCFICHEVTGWRSIIDNSPSNICSEECLAKSIEQTEEIKAERFMGVPDIVEAHNQWLTL